MNRKFFYRPVWDVAATLVVISTPAVSRLMAADATPPITVTVQAEAAGMKISPDLFGIFFEDINYAADGGLYAELIQNRSFEYSTADHAGWNALTSWELTTHGDGQGSVTVETNVPLNTVNPHYAVVTVAQGGEGVGLMNSGFDGIPLKGGDKYNLAFFARQTSGPSTPIIVRLESKTGTSYGEAKFSNLTQGWAKYTATISVTATDADARLVISMAGAGTFCFDTVSLFPQKTFHDHPNGLRADLAQVIADLHPKFVRFPGGCLTHGYGLGNIYRWKNTIGPIEQRKEQFNIWHYHQSVGLGFFEYFQYCEDIGAKPLPVLAAGVCCQNSPGGQRGVPMDEMQDYVQDVLDLVEYANGPTNSTWGAKRAAAGHPAPFHLEYLGIGNEDAQTPTFGIRFKMIYEAVKAKYPDITIVGTVGPSPSGNDFNEGWKFAGDLGVPVVDEHYYQNPDWFLSNLLRYDAYDRNGPKVYVGEYASWGNSLFNALAEAVYMTSLERNGDVVRMASYAPLLGKENHMQWHPNLIYFNNTTVCPSVNYYVQQLFSMNESDVYLPTTISSVAVKERPTGFLLGTWNTQAQFAGVKVISGDRTVVDESSASDAKNWTSETGDWNMANGIYTQSADGKPNLSRLTSSIDQSDYTLTLKARKTGGEEGFLIGFAATGTGDYYWWNLGGWGNSQYGLERSSHGVKSPVGKPVAASIESDRWYDIKIVVAEKRLKCYLDGKLIHDVSFAADGQFAPLHTSAGYDTKTGDLIVKVINTSAKPTVVRLNFPGADNLNGLGQATVLASENAKAEDTFDQPGAVLPQAEAIHFTGTGLTRSIPGNSFTVLRLNAK
ncbi:MAG TPA: alpha-L-arabinofuranosidase C-terminal domain-containing protein [Verrucomicrobiae bacterium]